MEPVLSPSKDLESPRPSLLQSRVAGQRMMDILSSKYYIIHVQEERVSAT